MMNEELMEKAYQEWLQEANHFSVKEAMIVHDWLYREGAKIMLKGVDNEITLKWLFSEVAMVALKNYHIGYWEGFKEGLERA